MGWHMDALDPNRLVDLSRNATATSDKPPSSLSVRTPTPARDLSELPEVDAGVLARAVLATRKQAPAAVSPADAAAKDAAVQRRLDDFLASATLTVHTSDGNVTMASPYRTAKDPGLVADDGLAGGIYRHQEDAVQAHQGALMKIAASIGIWPRDVLLVQLGRGSPENVSRLTQALVDHGRLPAKVVSWTMPTREARDLPTRIRAMMGDYGIGLDGAGYAQQALVASLGVPRWQTGLADPATPALTDLGARGFSRVGVDQARPGDIVAFSFGGGAIVRDRRETTESEAAALRRMPGFETGRITTLVVDGAWRGNFDPSGLGAGGSGVRRLTSWHDEASDQWATRDEHGVLRASHGPGDEYLEGVFRKRQRSHP